MSCSSWWTEWLQTPGSAASTSSEMWVASSSSNLFQSQSLIFFFNETSLITINLQSKLVLLTFSILTLFWSFNHFLCKMFEFLVLLLPWYEDHRNWDKKVTKFPISHFFCQRTNQWSGDCWTIIFFSVSVSNIRARLWVVWVFSRSRRCGEWCLTCEVYKCCVV